MNFRATYATFSCNSALARLKPERERGKPISFCPLRKLTKSGIFLHTKTGPEPLENETNDLPSLAAEGPSQYDGSKVSGKEKRVGLWWMRYGDKDTLSERER